VDVWNVDVVAKSVERGKEGTKPVGRGCIIMKRCRRLCRSHRTNRVPTIPSPGTKTEIK
jgi:hypothetical protein